MAKSQYGTISRSVREVNPSAFVSQYADASDMVSASFDAGILFLDIQMPGMDGMKAARILRTMGNKTIIVFVTAVEEYVFEVFDVGAVQYIVKPFDRNKLIETIKKALDLAKEKYDINAALLHANGSEEAKRSITIKSGGVNRRVILSEIEYRKRISYYSG